MQHLPKVKIAWLEQFTNGAKFESLVQKVSVYYKKAEKIKNY